MMYPEIRMELRQEARYHALANPAFYGEPDRIEARSPRSVREEADPHALPRSVLSVLERMLE